MEKTAGSRLMQIQARFQQKQLQERELKIASLYESQQARALDRVRMTPSARSVSPPQPAAQPPITRQPGKVRQMFEERRTKGIDKSYPLQPIHNTDRDRAALAQRKTTSNGYSKVTTSNTSRVVEKKTAKHTGNSISIRKQQHGLQKKYKIVNGSGDLNQNHEPDLNSVKQMPQSNGDRSPTPKGLDELDRIENNYLIEDETFPDALAPAQTPRSPLHQPEPKRPPRRSPAVRDSSVKTKPQAQPVPPPRKAAVESSVSQRNKPRGVMQGASTITKQTVSPKSQNRSNPGSGGNSNAHKTTPPSAAASGGEGACTVCGRRFAPDRIDKHQEICRRTANKKRKPFDALKHRLAGTEAEPLIGKLRAKKNASTTSVKPLNSTWRSKHEEFISAIRAAKQVKAHLDAGGKLSDLPPPPPSLNPDYVQCPHCQRRFNEAAAARHIPKCADYQYNKPKPGKR